MGLSNVTELPNGVTVSYYRIASLTVHVNRDCIIELAGYTSQGKRDEEAAQGTEVYVHTRYVNVPYDPDFSVSKAYALVKELDGFEGAEDVIDTWAANTAYYVGDLAMHGEQEYECIQPHTSQDGWEPPNAPALWKLHEEGGDGIPVWSQPTGSQDAYMTGDRVHYPTIEDPVYESTMDYNVHSPEAYPQGWRLVEGGE